MRKRTGTKELYMRAMSVAIPIMIQNGIMNLVNMLDNIMIGRVGTDPMSGVSIVNRLLFVWYLCMFGGTAGIGIFTAQFHGKGDENGARCTMRLMLTGSLLLVAAGWGIFLGGDDFLISRFLQGTAADADPVLTFASAKEYLAVMRFVFVPFAITQVYYSTLRACGETILPMKSGMIAMAINLVGNYVLIYGKFGAPALGVRGAAIATVLARCIETCFIIRQTHRAPDRYPFAKGVYGHLTFPEGLVRSCYMKALPLLLNELLWAGGQAVLTQRYSMRGLDVIASLNIAGAINDVFNIAFIAMGNAIGILAGQTLGAGKLKEAKEDAPKYIVFSAAICVCVGLVMYPFASFFPHIYNTTEEIRHLATRFIHVFALFMPVYATANACFFILRSGGKTLITFLFDSAFCWCVVIPLAHILVSQTTLPVLAIFVSVQAAEILKCLIGLSMIQKGIWVQNITV